MKFVIMTGGQGTKLWPISKDNYPKQYNKIIGGKSLFQLNVEALLQKYTPQDIYISTSENYVEYSKSQAPQIPEVNYIIEPHIKKGTGPASCFSMLKMYIECPDEVVMFYAQPDVVRNPVEKYLFMVGKIEKLVKKYGQLVSGGKYPLYVATGSDYLLLGNKIKTETGLEVYETEKFIDRPKNLEEGKTLIKNKNVTIHCNHLTWTPKEFFKALKTHHKNWYETSMELKKEIINKSPQSKIFQIYSKYDSGSTELFTRKLYDERKVQTVILPFEWAHITTWNDVYEYYKDRNLPTTNGYTVTVDSENNLIINRTNKLIGGINLKNMVIIQTEEALLVCPRADTGKLRGLLERVGLEGFGQYL